MYPNFYFIVCLPVLQCLWKPWLIATEWKNVCTARHGSQSGGKKTTTTKMFDKAALL